MDAQSPLSRPVALISRDALLHNLRLLRSLLPSHTKVCAMVKADAYGHDASLIAETLCNFSSGDMEAPGIDALAVATLEEATALGNSIVPLVIMRPVEREFIGSQRELLKTALRAGWVLTIGCRQAAMDVNRLAAACGQPAAVQVMVDTGMNREGTRCDTLDQLVQGIEALPGLRLRGICTHFAASESPDGEMTRCQLERFHAATRPLVQRNPRLVRHAANSGAVFFAPQAHLDMVRPGIALYGVDPSGEWSAQRPLRPVLRWLAPLLMVRDVKAGERVGYSGTWTADRDTRLGIVPVGYADGYLRAFSNRAAMLVRGRPAPVVGRVSMDYATIDLRDVPDAQPGDTVTVLDDDPRSAASALALAQAASTIPYEIFCRIGPRVARIIDEEPAPVPQVTVTVHRQQAMPARPLLNPES